MKKNNLINNHNHLLELNISEKQFESLSPEKKKEVEYYGYFNKKTNKWHVAFDVVRILNHNNGGDSNVTQDEDMVMTAKRNISKGNKIPFMKRKNSSENLYKKAVS